MEGGIITGNTVTKGSGAGVSNYIDATFIMTDGEITGNSASENGGGVMNRGTMTVGGTVKITGNTANGKSNNLYSGIGYPITFDDSLDEDSLIGVTMESAPGAFTTNGIKDYVDCFNSDDSTYVVKYVTDHLELAIPDDVNNATYSAYLALNENIDICLKIKSLGEDFSKDKLSVTVDDKAIDSDKIKVDATTASCVLAEVAPQNIDTVFNVVVTYNGVDVKSFSYSAVQYCNSVFKKYKSGELYDLCEALLNYGKWAAAYNGRSITVSDDHTKDFESYTFENIPTKETLGENAIGASLSIGKIITLKYEVEANETLTNTDEKTQNFYVMIGDKQIDPNRVKVTSNGGNSYTVSIDLYASQLSESYTLVPKNIDVGDFSVTYSAYNYCYDAQTMNAGEFTDTVKTLCKAIHNYGEAVKAYNTSK